MGDMTKDEERWAAFLAVQFELQLSKIVEVIDSSIDYNLAPMKEGIDNLQDMDISVKLAHEAYSDAAAARNGIRRHEKRLELLEKVS